MGSVSASPPAALLTPLRQSGPKERGESRDGEPPAPTLGTIQRNAWTQRMVKPGGEKRAGRVKGSPRRDTGARTTRFCERSRCRQIVGNVLVSGARVLF